jgi:hypothetical protein
MDNIIAWLLNGDVSVRYLTRKYLLDANEDEIQQDRKRIALEGWGKAFLESRNSNGHWGRDFYQVKWISSHYTLLDLRYIEIEPVYQITDTINLILKRCKSYDGSINEARSNKPGDICVNGMFLNYASFFGIDESELQSIIDYILDNQMTDGGFNCEQKTRGAVHSSMHTTISVLEGINEFALAGYTYRGDELMDVRARGESFLLNHRLFKSDKTGDIIDRGWTMLSYPSRWKYDILRALVYFTHADTPYDPRMQDAIDLIHAKRKHDGTWPVQAKHPGLVHFEMEKSGASSRNNTVRALRVLHHFRNGDAYSQ